MNQPAPLRWRKSTRSGSESNCVEIAVTSGRRVRDSKNVPGPSLGFTTSAFTEFLAAAKNGEFDSN